MRFTAAGGCHSGCRQSTGTPAHAADVLLTCTTNTHLGTCITSFFRYFSRSLPLDIWWASYDCKTEFDFLQSPGHISPYRRCQYLASGCLKDASLAQILTGKWYRYVNNKGCDDELEKSNSLLFMSALLMYFTKFTTCSRAAFVVWILLNNKKFISGCILDPFCISVPIEFLARIYACTNIRSCFLVLTSKSTC